ncbi:DUF2085 domain-containing protein [Candidatus Micrarchaeota archaeon]|nr:DUF2085 domain-containing protein [Candidatus Micrarchaeota archaeon]
MGNEKKVYLAYMILIILFVGIIFAIPYLAFTQDMGAEYNAFSYSCHQKLTRSICLFSAGSGYWIGDCTNQSGKFVNDPNDRTTIKVTKQDTNADLNQLTITGYKFPVCARDVGIYGALLLGGLVYPFVRKLENRTIYPSIWLILAIVPLGLDGTTQLVSELGLLPFVYESTNMMRLLTGAIAGFAAAFYVIPILVNIFYNERDIANETKSAKKNERRKNKETKK